MRASADGTQRLQLGLDMAQLAGVAHGEEITTVPEVAFDAMASNAQAHLLVGGTGNRGIHFEICEPLTADQLIIAWQFVSHHKA
ncbi:hypothetical protein D3C76_1345770 [compost metagenome]